MNESVVAFVPKQTRVAYLKSHIKNIAELTPVLSFLHKNTNQVAVDDLPDIMHTSNKSRNVYFLSVSYKK